MKDRDMTEPGAFETTKPSQGFHRILVASDLTAYSDRAFDRAAMLAEEYRGTIRFVHAVVPDSLPESYVQQEVLKAEGSLKQEVHDSGINQRLDVSITVSRGKAEEVIVDEAAAMKADLVVMGLSHDTSLTNIFRGTTIERVVRTAPCPVLVVKTRPWRRYKKIALALDLAEPSRRALDIALGAMPDGHFNIIHVNESISSSRDVETAGSSKEIERHNEIRDLITARASAIGRDERKLGDKFNLIVESGKASKALQTHVLHLAPDLVVLGTHGRLGVPKFFLGSVAEILMETLPQDLLVVRG